MVALATDPGQGVISSVVRQGELQTVLSLLDELRKLVARLQAPLPQLVLFAPALDGVQEHACKQLGPVAVHLLGWAWQRRAILGPISQHLLEGIPPDWRPLAEPRLPAWDGAVRASSAVENWHSILRPYLAVHRTLSTGMLARFPVWHNHRVAQRGRHQGQSPLRMNGLTPVTNEWLEALGYPPRGATSLPESRADPQPVLALVA